MEVVNDTTDPVDYAVPGLTCFELDARSHDLIRVPVIGLRLEFYAGSSGCRGNPIATSDIIEEGDLVLLTTEAGSPVVRLIKMNSL